MSFHDSSVILCKIVNTGWDRKPIKHPMYTSFAVIADESGLEDNVHKIQTDRKTALRTQIITLYSCG